MIQNKSTKKFRIKILITINFIALIVSIACYMMEIKLELLVTGILLTVIYTISAYEYVKQEKWILSPLVVFLLSSIFYVGLVPIWVYLCLIFGFQDWIRLGPLNVSHNVLLSNVLCILGTLCFWLGYELSGRSVLSKRFLAKRIINSISFRFRLIGLLYLIGFAWLFRALPDWGISVNRIGFMYRCISYIPIIAPFLVISTYWSIIDGKIYVKPSKLRLLLALVLLLFEVLFHGLHSGMRHFIVEALFILCWALVLQNQSYFRAKLNQLKLKRLILLLPLFLIVWFFVFSIFIPYGKLITSKSKDFAWRDINVASSLDPVRSFPDKGLWASLYRASLGSISAVGACIEMRSYQIEHEFGKKLLISLVPRVIWPNKPYVSQGASFTVILGIGNPLNEKEATTSTGVSAVGEFFWSYGFMGVVIGMFLVGFLFKVTFDYFSYNFPLNIVRAWVTALLILRCYLWFENEALSLFVMFTFIWVIFYPLSNLFFIHRIFKRSNRNLWATGY